MAVHEVRGHGSPRCARDDEKGAVHGKATGRGNPVQFCTHLAQSDSNQPGAALIGHIPCIRIAQPILQGDAGLPAQCLQARHIQQFARHAQ